MQLPAEGEGSLRVLTYLPPCLYLHLTLLHDPCGSLCMFPSGCSVPGVVFPFSLSGVVFVVVHGGVFVSTVRVLIRCQSVEEGLVLSELVVCVEVQWCAVHSLGLVWQEGWIILGG